ncbi:helix-turn-helix domain-containing protein [Salinicoccus sp. HZC-1]|uniref:helix-turn-helix domain-containing protein n=1 Tax=Salinicoccus sp. HZC-1 TaxID=3385497 RepID=UPI00398B0B01
MSLMNQLTTSLDELEQHTKGEKKLRTKKIRTKPIPSYSSKDIKTLRVKAGLSQKTLSEVIGVSSKTVEAWEQGKNKPSGSSARLLQILNDNPDIILSEIIEKSNEIILH